MPIYDNPTWQLMKAMASELLPDQSTVITKGQVHAWFQENYPRIKIATLDAHLNRMSINVPARIHHNIKPGNDDLFYRIDPHRFRLYVPNSDPEPIRKNGHLTSESMEDEEGIPPVGASSEFAYESDLRDYLANNLHLLEHGLRLYEEDGITGVEFPAGGRLIDILAVDSDSNFVVIELKVSKGYDRVVGQLLRYMSWIKQNLAEEGQTVRGAIVAREITSDLTLACSNVDKVSLYENQLSLSIECVS